jgi:hypothetical protein
MHETFEGEKNMLHRRLFKCAFVLTLLVVVAAVLFALTVPTPISEKDAFLHGLYGSFPGGITKPL